MELLKPVTKELKSEFIGVRLDAATHRRLLSLCSEANATISGAVSEIIKNYLNYIDKLAESSKGF